MKSGRKFKIENHLSLDEINELLKKFKEPHMIYQRLILLKLLNNGKTIKEASEFIGVRRETGSRWLKRYNENGVEGLMLDYKNCGRHSFLTDEQKRDLKEILSKLEKNYTLKDAKKIIKDNYGIDYSEKQVWVIIREQLGLK
jgi:transposase